MTDLALTQDDFLGGKVRLWQPRKGYRAGVDPVLLAASIPAHPGQSVLELGCGAGAASMCLSARVSGLTLTGVEVQPFYAGLARRNGAENGANLTVIESDLRALPPDLRQQRFDHVMMNPPYFDRQASTRAEDDGRDVALGGDTPLPDWIEVGARRLAPRGYLSLIQRIERLPEVLTAVTARLGSVVVRPIAARNGRAPGLFLLQARQGGRAAFHLSAPLILHDGPEHMKDGEDYSAAVQDILRNAGQLPIRD